MTNGDKATRVWRTSTYSNDHDCVETARTAAGLLVRDSKRSPGPVLEFTAASWDGFLGLLVLAQVPMEA
jgi:hypothetical protein